MPKTPKKQTVAQKSNSNVQEKEDEKLTLDNPNMIDDVILLIFTHLRLVDAFHLSITCKRLRKLFEQSCNLCKSLMIYRKMHEERVMRVEAECAQNLCNTCLTHNFEPTAVDKLTRNNRCLVALPDTKKISNRTFSP